MKRLTLDPRPGWQAKVEALGLVWHTAPTGQAYWNESAAYSFTPAEIASIEAATAELYRLFLEAGERIVRDDRMLQRFGIPAAFHAPICAAWDAEPPALNHGRFDLGFDGAGPPVLFEFNCDTPTSMLETAVVQWAWREEVFPTLDQFNSLHDRLAAKWRDIAPKIPDGHIWFCHVDDAAGEDTVTCAYLRDLARAAGIESTPIRMEDIGWDAGVRRFADLDERAITAMFHLYPWEWLAGEGGDALVESLDSTLWIEPVWKMLWSNKAVLAVLWEMFPGHPNLLPAKFNRPTGDHVSKPFLSREGANVTITRRGEEAAATGGDYGAEGFVHQSLFALPQFDGRYPVIGSWIVDGEPAGMGVREGGLVTDNTAAFVPHVIEG